MVSVNPEPTHSASSSRPPVVPLELEALHRPTPLLREQAALLAVLSEPQHREALQALDTVFQAELQRHLEMAAFCRDSEERSEHRGVVNWLREYLGGAVTARAHSQARERLNVHPDEGEPQSGTPYMESDDFEGTA